MHSTPQSLCNRTRKTKDYSGLPLVQTEQPRNRLGEMHPYLVKEQDNHKLTPKPSVEEETDQEDWRNHTINLIEELDDEEIGNAVLISYIEEMKIKVWINVKGNMTMELAIKENEKKAKLTNEKLVPEDLHEFLDVFDKNKANQFPKSNMWDHKIDIKEGFEPKSFKNYNLTPEKQKEWNKFLDKNLEKGYIRSSQSPMASPFFFIKKKDRKLRPCQDYQYLNDWTVKNAYPLPLISKIMDNVTTYEQQGSQIACTHVRY